MAAISNQSPAVSNSTALPATSNTQVNQSLVQEELTSFETTHSKICSYLKKNGPSSVMRLYEMLHGPGNDAEDDLDCFQKALLKITTRYVHLESGLVDLVESVQNRAVVKIFNILECKGVLESAQLLRYFKQIATADEVKVVAGTKSAFMKTLTLLDFVCVLKDKKVCLWSDVKRQVISKVAEYVKQCGSIHVEKLTRWFQKEATQEELEVCEKEQKGLLDILNDANDVFTVEDSLVNYRPCPRDYDLAKVPTNFEYSETTEVSSRETLPISAAFVELDGQTPANVFQGKCQNPEDVMDQKRINDAVAHDEGIMESDSLSVSLQTVGEKINKTAIISADKDGLSARLSAKDLAVLQHYADENGPTTVSQLHGLLPKTSSLSVEELRAVLQRQKGLFRFTEGGFVYSDETKLRAIYTIAKHLEDTRGSRKRRNNIKDVRDWFLLHVPKQDKRAFPTSHKECEFRKQLEQFPHIFKFVLGENGENRVSLAPHFSPESILPQETGLLSTDSVSDVVQVNSDKIRLSKASPNYSGVNVPTECFTQTAAIPTKVNVTLSENLVQSVTTIGASEEKVPGTTFLGNTGFLKHKYIYPLLTYLNQNGPSSLTELQSVLVKETGFENVPSVQELKDSLQRYDAKFVFHSSGLVGPTEAMLRAADKIANFLKSKGTIGTAVLRDWYLENSSNEEMAALSLSPKHMQAVKKNLKLFPHMFVIGNGIVGLHPDYIPRDPKSSLPSVRCSKPTQGIIQVIPSETGASQENQPSSGSHAAHKEMSYNQSSDEWKKTCKGSVPLGGVDSDKALSPNNSEATLPTTFSMRTVTTKQSKVDVTSSENSLQSGTSMGASESEKEVPETTFYGFTGFLKHKYILPLLVYVNQNGPSSLTELQNVLIKEMGTENVPSVQELKDGLQCYNTKFVFHSSGVIGPTEIMQRAADKIANFLKSKGTIRATALRDWFQEYGSEKEKAALSLSTKGGVGRNLKLFPHIFVVGNGFVSLHPDYIPKESAPSLPAERCTQPTQSTDVLLQETCQQTQKRDGGNDTQQGVSCNQNSDNLCISAFGALEKTNSANTLSVTATPEIYAQHRQSVALPQHDSTFYGKSGFLKNKHVKPLQVYVNQKGPTSLSQLQKVLNQSVGGKIELSIKELRRNLLHHNTKFMFLPDGLIGPNKSKRQALDKIAEFLKAEGPSSLTDIRNWYWNHSSTEEKSILGLSERKSLKKHLMLYPHVFVIKNNMLHFTQMLDKEKTYHHPLQTKLPHQHKTVLCKKSATMLQKCCKLHFIVPVA